MIVLRPTITKFIEYRSKPGVESQSWWQSRAVHATANDAFRNDFYVVARILPMQNVVAPVFLNEFISIAQIYQYAILSYPDIS